jgi:hypothetical protein
MEEYIVEPILIKNGKIIGIKKITPPIYVNINDQIDKLYLERRDLYFQYKIIQDKIILDDKPAIYKSDYNNIINKLTNIQTQINQLHEYYENTEPSYEIEKKLELCEQYIKNAQTIKDRVKYKRQLYQLYREYPELKAADITHYMIQDLQIEELSEDNTKARAKAKPLHKNKGKKLPAKISTSDIKKIRDNVKELMKSVLKPKTFEECRSQKRSQPYYMKKEDILKEIDNNPDIKKLLPDNYKALNKDEICKYLFPKSPAI